MSRDRRGSWALPAPSGAYAELPAWWSAAAWFDAVMDALRTPEGEELRRRARVAYADGRSGLFGDRDPGLNG